MRKPTELVRRDASGFILRISGNTVIYDIPSGFTNLEQINVVDDWGISVDHYTIDDHPLVKNKLSTTLKSKVSR